MINKFKDILYFGFRRILPNKIFRICWKWYIKSNPKYDEYRYRYEYFVSRKKSNEKYCIMRYGEMVGIFSAAFEYLYAYDWAIANGYIPIVDHEYEYCFQINNFDEDNMWEYVFEQPISVSEALKKDWVFVAEMNLGNMWRPQMCKDINGKRDDFRVHMVKDGWREYYAKVNQCISKSWKFRKELLEEFENEYGAVFEKGNILGVVLRENFTADVEKLRDNANAVAVFREHPKTIGIEDTINLVKEYIASHNCSSIFVSTVFEESLSAFIEAFGNQVIWVERKRDKISLIRPSSHVWSMSEEERYLYGKSTQSTEEKRERCTTYVKEIFGLSRCDYLIAAPCSGSIAALSLNGGNYKDIYLLPDFNNAKSY